jgi:hypothetical protein
MPSAAGRRILAEVLGYGATADASTSRCPRRAASGGVRAARRALEKAGLAPSEVDHVNAHATSTPEGDPAELAGFRTVFGEHAPRLSITATKGAIGHTLGAAGAIGASPRSARCATVRAADAQPDDPSPAGRRARLHAARSARARDPRRWSTPSASAARTRRSCCAAGRAEVTASARTARWTEAPSCSS